MNIFATVFTLVVAGQMAHCWDQGLRDYILNIHNDMRKRPNACEMNKMIYDMDLENQAKGWAHGCVFEHEMKKGRGENLAYDTNKMEERKHIDFATDSWYDEINMYSYGQHSCSMSCHYTQLVWAKTNKVGCYSYVCPRLRNAGSFSNVYYLVCFYTPMGNWNGEKPYKTSCPSKCAKGQTEEDGLCIGDAIVPCVDEGKSCANWASRGQCEKNAKYMKKKCKKSCKVCSDGKGSGGDKVVVECKDDNNSCASWASRGECRNNPGYMKKKCKKSCKTCG